MQRIGYLRPASLMLVALWLAPLTPVMSDDAPNRGAFPGDSGIAPGQVLRLAFPDLPPTFFAMRRGNKLPEAAVSVRLPDNYTPDRKFPLFVYLSPNDGGVGGDIATPLKIIGEDDYILANFPLFRRSYDPTVSWGLHIGVDDHPVIGKAYTAIMSRINERIPNIEPSGSIIGGYSNGANTVAALLSAMDETTLKSFNGFFMIDCGFDWATYKRTAQLGEHHILYIVGGGDVEDPEWWREDLVNHIRFLDKSAKYMGIKTWRFEIVPGVGHAFPDAYYAIIRDWAAKMGASKRP